MNRWTDPRMALLALLCGVSQLAASTHLLLVRHEACPAHGELLHGGEAHAEHVRGPIRTVASWTGVPAAEETHEHEHCSVPCERRRPAVIVASELPRIASTAIRTPAREHGTTLRGIAPLQLAPKQGPPQA